MCADIQKNVQILFVFLLLFVDVYIPDASLIPVQDILSKEMYYKSYILKYIFLLLWNNVISDRFCNPSLSWNIMSIYKISVLLILMCRLYKNKSCIGLYDFLNYYNTVVSNYLAHSLSAITSAQFLRVCITKHENIYNREMFNEGRRVWHVNL